MTNVMGTFLDAVHAAGVERALIVLPKNAEAEAIEAILASPHVAGGILQYHIPTLAEAYQDRVGWIAGGGDIVLPDIPADALVSFQNFPFWAEPMERRLLAAGIRNFYAYEPRARALRAIQPPRESLYSAIERRIKYKMTPTYAGQPWDHEDWWRRIMNDVRTLANHPILTREAFDSELIALAGGSLSAGGSERQMTLTAAGLAQEKRRVVLSLMTKSHMHEPYVSRALAAGVHLEEAPPYEFADLPAALMPLLNALGRRGDLSLLIVKDLLRFAAHFLRLRPRVVHTWLDWTNVAAGLAALAVGVPRIVLSGRSLSPTHFSLAQPFMRPVYRTLLSSPRVDMLNNSEAGARDYAAWLGVSSRRIKVIRNGVAADELARPPASQSANHRAELGIPGDAPVLGGLMRFHEEKRPVFWVEIAAALRERLPNAWFVLGGYGPLEADMRSRARELGLEDRLIWLGKVEDAARAFSIMDAFLLTSRAEGLPNVLIEAQMLGVPVFTSAVGGAPETLEEGVTGWSVQGDKPEPYADRIAAVLADEAIRARAAERGPIFVQQRFGVERMLTETLAVYREA